MVGIAFLLKREDRVHGQKEIVDDGCGWIPFVAPLAALSEHYEFVVLDARREGGRGAGEVDPNRGNPLAVFHDFIVKVDLADSDIKKYRAYFKDVDAVIHNGWIYREATPRCLTHLFNC